MNKNFSMYDAFFKRMPVHELNYCLNGDFIVEAHISPPSINGVFSGFSNKKIKQLKHIHNLKNAHSGF